MNRPPDAPSRIFRIWLVRIDGWRPASCFDVPPRAVSIEPALEECLTANQAAAYLEGFNQERLFELTQQPSPGVATPGHCGASGCAPPVWAVAVPVVVRYEGDPRPGEPVRGERVNDECRRTND